MLAMTVANWQSPRLEIGNYDVVIPLGGERATTNVVKFAGRRLAAERIVTAAGEKKDFAFTARVPGPVNRSKNGEFSLKLSVFTEDGEGGKYALTPKVTPAPNSSTIYLCGDSTVTDQQREPWGSWGQILPAFIKSGWACSNFARSGLAMSTFESDNRLNRILEHLKAGDWVLVQFGHNDQKREGEEPENGYTRRYGEWYEKFKAKGASLVVISPCERRRFEKGVHGEKTLAGYAQAAKAFAEKNKLPFIDLNDITYQMHEKLGEKGTLPLQVNNKGKIDNTHHTIFGAYVNARIVASHLSAIPGIGAAIREEYREYDPFCPVNPKIPPSGKVDWTKPEGN